SKHLSQISVPIHLATITIHVIGEITALVLALLLPRTSGATTTVTTATTITTTSSTTKEPYYGRATFFFTDLQYSLQQQLLQLLPRVLRQLAQVPLLQQRLAQHRQQQRQHPHAQAQHQQVAPVLCRSQALHLQRQQQQLVQLPRQRLQQHQPHPVQVLLQRPAVHQRLRQQRPARAVLQSPALHHRRQQQHQLVLLQPPVQHPKQQLQHQLQALRPRPLQQCLPLALHQSLVQHQQRKRRLHREVSVICSSAGRGTLGSVSGNNPSSGWSLFRYNFTATDPSPMMLFGFQSQNNRYYFMDEVSVVSVNAPSIELLQNRGFKNSSTATTGWDQYCVILCGSSAGVIFVGSSCYGGAGNCFKDGCTGTGNISDNVDFLGQAFSASTGGIYIRFQCICFWVNPALQLPIYLQ
ncbi:unnamed protein product, partial [Rotaria magnacalcarata]